MSFNVHPARRRITESVLRRRRAAAVVHVAGVAGGPGSRVSALHHSCHKEPPRQLGTRQHLMRPRPGQQRAPVRPRRRDDATLLVPVARGRCRRCHRRRCRASTNGTDTTLAVVLRDRRGHGSGPGLGGGVLGVVSSRRRPGNQRLLLDPRV